MDDVLYLIIFIFYNVVNLFAVIAIIMLDYAMQNTLLPEVN
jgi:hypothetical protein